MPRKGSFALSFALAGAALLPGAPAQSPPPAELAAQPAEATPFLIQGTTTDIPDQLIYLELATPGEDRPLLSGRIEAGHFELRGHLASSPTLCTLRFENPNYFFIVEDGGPFRGLLVDREPIRLELGAEPIQPGAPQHMVAGSVTTKGAAREYAGFRGELQARFGAIEAEAIESLQALNIDWSKPDAQASLDEATLARLEELRGRLRSLDREKLAFLRSEATLEADSMRGLYAIMEMVSGFMVMDYAGSPDFLLQFAGQLGEDVRDTQPAQYLRALLNGRIAAEAARGHSAVGQRSPNITLPDVDGTAQPLSEALIPGGYLLVEFWASWCGPCRAEAPNILATYEAFHTKGFDVYAVSLDEDRAAWLKAIEQDETPWLHVSDLRGFKSETAKLFGVEAIPTNLLLDEDGVIVARDLRGESLAETIEQLFGAQ